MFGIRVSRTPDKRSLNSESATPGRAWVSTKKGGSGSRLHHTDGTYFLMITAEGDWTVTVIQLP